MTLEISKLGFERFDLARVSEAGDRDVVYKRRAFKQAQRCLIVHSLSMKFNFNKNVVNQPYLDHLNLVPMFYIYRVYTLQVRWSRSSKFTTFSM